ncbi:hypothetical protein GWK47_031807 [Chionoecetes opilio]|uniref:Uncharacterized protein n=1 Tax=Chionoecetes opilio TaxID=41210 RepID=A0A8J5D1Z9_CHIOP|nr:hypothetical protein GWK47_031807 [Chionoecetes opilio]
MSHVVHEGAKSRRIDVVFDVYKETSIKDAERANRSAGTGIHFKNIQPGHNIQRGREKFIGSSSNKASLIKFLVEEWKKPQHRRSSRARSCMSHVSSSASRSPKSSGEEVPELKSSQEEADTRLLLHALHGSRIWVQVCHQTLQRIQTSWSCVWACAHKIPSHLFQKCGTKNRTRFLDITTLSRKTGRQRV